MSDWRALLVELAVPRRSGSSNNTQVRGALKRELAARGFVVLEHHVTLSPRPIWAAATVGRALAIVAAMAGLGVLAHPRGFWTPVVLFGVAGGFALHAVGAILGRVSCPLPDVPGVNLIGVRPRTRVTHWLVAHYDSKGQRLSMAGRLLAVALATVGAGAAAALAVASLAGVTVPLAAWLVALGAMGLGGQRLGRAGLSDDSPGAVDNASGLLAALATVDALPPTAAVGVIFPDGEELGLMGARALVRERANLLAGTAVINFDGIDDRGPVIAVAHRAGPTVDRVVGRTGARRWRRLPVVVDGLILAPAAAECVTMMRGHWATMRVVHRPGDTAQRLDLTGMKTVSGRVADALFPG